MVSSFFEQAEELSSYFFEEEEQQYVNPIVGPDSVVTPYYSAALGKPQAQITNDLESGLASVLYADANSKANDLNTTASETAIATGLQNQDLTLERIQELSKGLMFENFVAPDIASMIADSPEYTAIERRALERAVAAERLIAERIDGPNSFWGGLGYFADSVTSSFAHNILGLTGLDAFEGGSQLVELAQEAADLLTIDLTKEEFQEKFSSILDRVNDSGFFTEENPFILGEFISLVQEGGRGFKSELTKVFQVLDVITAAASPAVIRTTVGLANAPRILTKLSSIRSAEKAITEALSNGVSNPMTIIGQESGLVRQGTEMFSHPSLEVMRQLETENQALTFIKNSNFGPRIDPNIVESKRAEWISDTKERNATYDRNTLDYSVREGPSGILYGSAVIGKHATGGPVPYITVVGAQRMADKIGGEVLPIIEAGRTKYVVVKDYDIPTQGLSEATDLNQVANGLLSSIMSTTARTTVNLDSMIKQGEQQVARVLNRLGKNYNKAGRKISRGERDRVNGVLYELQSDPNFSHRVEPYNPSEFAIRYEEKFGEEASQDVINFYKSVQEINDVDYYINADIILKEAIDNNETMLKLDNSWWRSRKTTSVDEDAIVYDVDTGKLQRKSDLDPNTVIYEIKDAAYKVGEEGNVRYVTAAKPTTRRLYHTDVMPYNAGGHRKYTDVLDIYIKQDSGVLKLAGGGEMHGKPITIMAVRTEKEAADVVTSWNNIIEALNNGGDVGATILRNNAWNPNIEDIADLQRFASDHGLDLTKPLKAAPDNEPAIGDAAREAGARAFAGSSTVGQAFRNSLMASRTRGKAPLIGYGGEVLNTMDPTKAIERGFAQTVTRYGDANYNYNAINGWFKAAKANDAILNADEIAKYHPKRALFEAKLRNTEAGRALESERKTIQRRMSGITAQVASERRIMRSFADWLYDKDKKKLAKMADWSSTKDPAGFFRALAFHTKLGLGAIDQVYVQASQLINVVGITSDTLGYAGAIRGALGAFPLRIALIEDLPAGVIERVAKIQAGFTSIPAEDFIKLSEWIKSTGRNVVDKTIVEQNNVAVFARGKNILDYGQTFFNEGELLARLSAATSNLLERQAKYGMEDIFDPIVTRQMIQRQDVLTASMTSASAAPWQRSLLAVPLQFTTYHVRMVEQLFTDNILTKSERIRLAATHAFMYGSAGIPLAGVVQDRMGYTGTVDPNNPVYDVVRYGALDAILSTISGSDTALSGRLAVGEGLFDLYKSLQDKNLMEFAGGPAGSISFEVVKAFVSMNKNIFAGDFDHLSYDWNRMARNITSYNRAYNFSMAQMYGAYYSRKTEERQAENLTTPEAFALMLGIPLKEQEALWVGVANTMLDDAFLDARTKEILRLEEIANKRLEVEDYEGAEHFFNDIGAELELLPLSAREKVMQRLSKNLTIQDTMTRSLFKRGRVDFANYLQELTNG